MRFQKTVAGLACALGLLSSHSASAQEAGSYPNKPVRLIVTFPPGGASDSMVRLVAPRLQEQLGQPIVVDNRPGAGGNIGLSAAAQALPDGYTVALGAAGGLSANVSLYPKMPFDPAKDFKAVGMLAVTPFVIVGHPSVPARTLKEVIALVKTKPGALSIGHGGNGTAMHLSTALFKQMANLELTEVPYRGNAPAAVDVLSRQVALALIDLPTALQHIKSGKLIAYAVTSAQRLPTLPEIPTVAESGVPGYESVGWFGFVVPASTPAPIVTRLNGALKAALGEEPTKASMRNLGAEPISSTPMQFEDYIASETKKWAQVIKTANIKLD